jgi:hypothetical protein
MRQETTQALARHNDAQPGSRSRYALVRAAGWIRVLCASKWGHTSYLAPLTYMTGSSRADRWECVDRDVGNVRRGRDPHNPQARSDEQEADDDQTLPGRGFLGRRVVVAEVLDPGHHGEHHDVDRGEPGRLRSANARPVRAVQPSNRCVYCYGGLPLARASSGGTFWAPGTVRACSGALAPVGIREGARAWASQADR